jgi:two-component system NtrC family sensor kinase
MSHETVLVIEDNPDMRTILCDAVLDPAGYRFVTASDGRKGLEEAVESNPDLILLDLQLPRLSGIDLLGVLDRHDLRIPTIVISAYGSEETILRAFRLGAKDFLQKPFTIDQAQSAIENALTEERLRREKENLTTALAVANRRLQQQVRNWSALNDIALTITSTLKESEVYRRVIESVNRILRLDAGSLLLLDREAGCLELATTTVERGQKSHYRPLETGGELADWVIEHGKPGIMPDSAEDDRFYTVLDDLSEFPSPAILCIPLESRERTIGVLEVVSSSAEPGTPPFTQEDLDLLMTLAAWVTVAVENAQLNQATAKMAATTALGQAVAAMAHHINNRLMTFSLQLDELEREDPPTRRAVAETITSARKCVREISAVVKALDRLGEIHTVPYVGQTEMIDIEEPLEEQLRLISAQQEQLRNPG